MIVDGMNRIEVEIILGFEFESYVYLLGLNNCQKELEQGEVGFRFCEVYFFIEVFVIICGNWCMNKDVVNVLFLKFS